MADAEVQHALRISVIADGYGALGDLGIMVGGIGQMRHLLAAAVALAIGGAAPAHAALVTFDFSAVQNGFVGDVPIPNGAAFDGSITIDTSTPGTATVPGTLFFEYFGAVKSFDLSGEVIDVSGWAVNEVAIADSASGVLFHFLANNNGADIELFLGSTTLTDPSGALPTTLPDISVFDSAHILDFGDPSGSAHDTVGNPGSAVDAVPEPSGLVLFASSLLMLGLLAIGLKRKGEALAA